MVGSSRARGPYTFLNDELAPYELDQEGHRDVYLGIKQLDNPRHGFTIGSRVRSELSGRTGIVKQATSALVLVEFDDIRSNVDYAKAPDAWVPHGVLEKVRGAS
jgi:hypothetical protein